MRYENKKYQNTAKFQINVKEFEKCTMHDASYNLMFLKFNQTKYDVLVCSIKN